MCGLWNAHAKWKVQPGKWSEDQWQKWSENIPFLPGVPASGWKGGVYKSVVQSWARWPEVECPPNNHFFLPSVQHLFTKAVVCWLFVVLLELS